MRKALIAIGVGNTDGSFPKLKGAAKDARDFHAWGKAQGFDCTLLVDERKKIRVADVYEAIDSYVRQNTYSQIIVYFSGHGILKAPECELWLMSGAPRNGNEVVNVQGSIFNARTCGIAHVVFISDACRSLPTDLKTAALSAGQQVFPYIAWRPPVPEVDVFYATLPGDIALELPPDETIARDRGLLTQCLLAALEGKVPQVIKSADVDGVAGHIVPSRPLKAWLTSQLPLTASDISFKLQQHPDVRIESDMPKYLSKLKDGAGASRLVPSSATAVPTWNTAHSMHQNAGKVCRLVPSREPVRGPWPLLGQALTTVTSSPATSLGTHPQRDSIARVFHAANPAQHVHTGFVSQGGRVESAMGERGVVMVSSDAHHSWIELDDEGDLPGIPRGTTTERVALRFANGRGIVLAVLPGYVGTVVFDGGEIATVNYTPSLGSPNFQEFASCSAEIEERRTQVAVAAQRGTFSLESAGLTDAAEFVRTGAAVDPTLSLYLSYAHARAGKFAAIHEISAMLSHGGQPVPFDVAMLAAQGSGGPFPRELPGMPMLTQGWLMLGEHEAVLPQPLSQARQLLLPSLWATFSPDGMSILERYIQKKD
ncbi:MAG: caspase family protein [Acidovorax sp.]